MGMVNVLVLRPTRSLRFEHTTLTDASIEHLCEDLVVSRAWNWVILPECDLSAKLVHNGYCLHYWYIRCMSVRTTVRMNF